MKYIFVILSLVFGATAQAADEEVVLKISEQERKRMVEADNKKIAEVKAAALKAKAKVAKRKQELAEQEKENQQGDTK